MQCLLRDTIVPARHKKRNGTHANHSSHKFRSLIRSFLPTCSPRPRWRSRLSGASSIRCSRANSQVLLGVAAETMRLGAGIGFFSILHTSKSNLVPHYHIYCVAPAGGLSADHRRWNHTRHPLFLLLIPTLRTVSRTKFLDRLRQLCYKGLPDCKGPAAAFGDPAWFVYAIEL
jgi:hypothetical protein